jgi:hypothetical protein
MAGGAVVGGIIGHEISSHVYDALVGDRPNL